MKAEIVPMAVGFSSEELERITGGNANMMEDDPKAFFEAMQEFANSKEGREKLKHAFKGEPIPIGAAGPIDWKRGSIDLTCDAFEIDKAWAEYTNILKKKGKGAPISYNAMIGLVKTHPEWLPRFYETLQMNGKDGGIPQKKIRKNTEKLIQQIDDNHTVLLDERWVAFEFLTNPLTFWPFLEEPACRLTRQGGVIFYHVTDETIPEGVTYYLRLSEEQKNSLAHEVIALGASVLDNLKLQAAITIHSTGSVIQGLPFSHYCELSNVAMLGGDIATFWHDNGTFICTADEAKAEILALADKNSFCQLTSK